MSLYYTDPIDETKTLRYLSTGDYIHDGDNVFIANELSNCILSLKVLTNGDLADLSTRSVVGHLVKTPT